jgi:hypothetical protein
MAYRTMEGWRQAIVAVAGTAFINYDTDGCL